MDKKASSILEKFYCKFTRNEFSEDDVFSFLIFAREHLPNNSVLKEFTHFIAHRERDRGVTFNYLKKLSDLMHDTNKLPQNGIKLEGLYSLYEINESINNFWVQFEYPPLPTTTILDIISCMISLLQEVPLIKDDNLVGKLTVILSPNEIMLNAVLDATDYFKISNDHNERNPVKLHVPIIKMYTEKLFEGVDMIKTENNPLYIERTDKGLGIKLNKD